MRCTVFGPRTQAERVRSSFHLVAVISGAAALLASGPTGGWARSSGASPAAPVPEEAFRSSGQLEGLRGSAFGYRLGEERRYVLEPEDSLPAGEKASWLIRLDRFEGEGADRLAVFAFEHELDQAVRELFSPRISRILNIRVGGEVFVNGYGFPRKLVLTEQDHLSGERANSSELRATIYSLEDDQFLKQVRLGGMEWQFKVPIAGHRDLDLEKPRGLYLFLPSALRCLGRWEDIWRPPPMARNGCDFGNPAFANPGFLSLVLPDLWEEEDGEKEVLFFTPVGVGTRPAGLINMPRWISSERDAIRNLQRYYDHAKLKLAELTEVEIGSRTIEAWRLDVGGAVGDVYIDSEGTVLRVDIAPHPRTLADRWIRLLFASEY